MYKLYDILTEAEISDAENIKIIAAKYPQYNFDKATIFTKKISDKTKTSGYKNVKYLNGLFCPKIDPTTGKPHGYSDGLKVANLKSPEGIIGCRICSKNYIDIEKEIKNFPYPEKGYIFDPKNFYRKKVGKNEEGKWYVKNILCTKHNKPLLFAQDGIAWDNIKNDKGGCPTCEPIKSRGNNEVYRVLEKLGYNDYKKEKTFPGANGCYGFKGQDYCDLLRYDAYVEKDGKPICIEYDGEQHFFPIPHFGGQAGLDARKELDQRKTEYCENNGIRLIRIPYTEFNEIESRLKEEIGFNDKISEAQRLQKLAGIDEIKIIPSAQLSAQKKRVKKWLELTFDGEEIDPEIESKVNALLNSSNQMTEDLFRAIWETYTKKYSTGDVWADWDSFDPTFKWVMDGDESHFDNY